MGNCCEGENRANITGKEGSEAKVTGYGPHSSSTVDGHAASNVRMMSSGATLPGGARTGTALRPGHQDYAHQPSLRYPADASGVHYQPTGGPSVLLGMPFDDNENQHNSRPHSTPSEAAVEAIAAAEAVTQNTTTTTTTTVQTATTSPAETASPPKTPQPKPPVVDSVTPAVPLRQESNYQPSDVMISYSRNDGEIMQQIKDELEAESITVWVDQTSIDAGADFLSKIGEAIIDAKFFICILSERAVRSKYCRDEVALAYVSNTAIFPVNLQPRDTLLPLMDTGLKLQLANYNWTTLTEPQTRRQNIRHLVATMKAELDDLAEPMTAQDDSADSAAAAHQAAGSLPFLSPVMSVEDESEAKEESEVVSPRDVTVTAPKRQVTVIVVNKSSSPAQSPASEGEAPEFNRRMRRLRERNLAVMKVKGDDDAGPIMPEKFWTEQFGVVDYVTWDRFTEAFVEVFKDLVRETFTSDDQQQLLDILRRELEVGDDDRIFKYQLLAFCSIYGDASPLWVRVHEQARESFAMREVFNMDSSVRVEAIENLGKFRSAAVIDALRDLLTDPDANVRAVATVSLSRTNANDPVTIRHILRTLSDKDRLVREAGCLALGHLKARQAISKLSHLWRNDVISHVREAAAVALHQIGGQEVEDVMRVTKVLAEEIRSLTEEKPH
ncbi:hypothetical protein ACOMHN_001453 [Nucella lapillus]